MCRNTKVNNRLQHHILRSNNFLRKPNTSNNRTVKRRSRTRCHQHFQNLLTDLLNTNKANIKIHTDSSSGKSIATRIGTGKKTKHVELKHLFIQQLVALNHLRIIKIHTNDNPADIFTKYVSAETLRRHLTSVGLHIQHYPHASFWRSNIQCFTNCFSKQ